MLRWSAYTTPRRDQDALELRVHSRTARGTSTPTQAGQFGYRSGKFLEGRISVEARYRVG